MGGGGFPGFGISKRRGSLLVYNLYKYISGKRGCRREYSEGKQVGAFGDYGVCNLRILLLCWAMGSLIIPRGGYRCLICVSVYLSLSTASKKSNLLNYPILYNLSCIPSLPIQPIYPQPGRTQTMFYSTTSDLPFYYSLLYNKSRYNLVSITNSGITVRTLYPHRNLTLASGNV